MVAQWLELSPDTRGVSGSSPLHSTLTYFKVNMETEKIWLIKCSLDCKCCTSQTHVRGPYTSYEAADKSLNLLQENGALSSDHSSSKYEIIPAELERISENRVIINNRVFFDYDLYPDAGLILQWHE